MNRGKQMKLIEHFALIELDESEDPNMLFRTNTIAVRFASAYFKLVSQEYLQKTLCAPIEEITKDISKYNIKIDTLKKKALEKNIKNVMLVKHKKKNNF
jgi:hypothetical protein